MLLSVRLQNACIDFKFKKMSKSTFISLNFDVADQDID